MVSAGNQSWKSKLEHMNVGTHLEAIICLIFAGLQLHCGRVVEENTPLVSISLLWHPAQQFIC